ARLGRACPRGQRPGEPVFRGPQDDAADGGPVRLRRRERHQEPQGQEGEEGQGARSDAAEGARRVPWWHADVAARGWKWPGLLTAGRRDERRARLRPVEVQAAEEQVAGPNVRGGTVVTTERVRSRSRAELPITQHLSGVVLPDGEQRDLWITGGRVTFEPV